MHKQSRKYSKFLVDPNSNPDNPHEMRFCALPFDGLPEVYSKVKRAPEMTMDPISGRKVPQLDGITGVINSLRRGSVNDNIYDYNLEKSTRAPITRKIQFDKLGKKYDNTGIYGDLFDTNRKIRFGSSIEDCADHDKATFAKTTLVKPKIL